MAQKVSEFFGGDDNRDGVKKNEKVLAPSDKFQESYGNREPNPNVELPPQVIAEDGALTLFADYKNPEKSGIPLYLVNRTGREIDFSTQDGDLYLRLEYAGKDGNWIRDQVYRASWCGNSHNSMTLLPGDFVKRIGYFPGEGKAVTVRYRSVENGLVSNAGPGFFLDLDREAAALDDKARNEIPSPLTGILIVDYRKHSTLFSDDDYLFALQLISEFRDSKYYRNEAAKKIAGLGKSSPFIPKIQEILDRPWPLPQDENAGKLVQLCLDRIKEKDHAEIAWNTIAGMLETWPKNRYSLTRDQKSDISAAFSVSLKNKNEKEILSASRLVEIKSFANEYIVDDQILELFDFNNEFLSLRAVKVMASRGRFERVARKAGAMDEKHQFRILQHLARGKIASRYGMPVNYLPSEKTEQQFWEMLFSKNPVEAVQSMPYFSGDRNPYSHIAHAPLKKFLEKEIKSVGSEPKNVEGLYDLGRVVQFFGDFRRKKDIQILESLLRHPGYDVGRLYREKGVLVGKRNFKVRKAARDALFQMQVSVDSAIIFEDKNPVQLNGNGGGFL